MNYYFLWRHSVTVIITVLNLLAVLLLNYTTPINVMHQIICNFTIVVNLLCVGGGLFFLMYDYLDGK